MVPRERLDLKILDVGIVGAGTAGNASAIILARDGHRVTLYERAPTPGPVGGTAHAAKRPRGVAAPRSRSPCARKRSAHRSPGLRHHQRALGVHLGLSYKDGNQGEPKLLADAYRVAMRLAEEARALSIALPLLSAGAYGYPLREAAAIAVTTLRAEAKKVKGLELVRLVAYEGEALDALRAVP